MEDVLLCPNFVASEDAPTTANEGDEKKVFTACSAILLLCERRIGMKLVMDWCVKGLYRERSCADGSECRDAEFQIVVGVISIC